MGLQYYSKEFKCEYGKKAFPDIENPKLSEHAKEDVMLKSEYLDEGIKILKKEVNRCVFKEGFTMRNSRAMSMPRLNKDPDVITPLVFLMRGNQDIRRKKRNYLTQVKSQDLTKKNLANEKLSLNDPLVRDTDSSYNITINPVTNRLEFKDKELKNYKPSFWQNRTIKAKSKFLDHNIYKRGPKQVKSHVHNRYKRTFDSKQNFLTYILELRTPQNK